LELIRARLAFSHFGEGICLRSAARAWLLAATLALGACGSAFAEPAQPEFQGKCVMGLALGKVIETDCSVSAVYGGKTYCFGNETARELFLKKPEEFLLKAHIFYSSQEQPPAKSE